MLFQWPKKIIAVCKRGKVRVFVCSFQYFLKFQLCVLREHENGQFSAYLHIRNVGVAKMNVVD